MSKEEKIVAKIIEDVKKSKDSALIKYTAKFDKVTLRPGEIKVSQSEIDEAYFSVSQDYLFAIRKAIKNIRAYHEKQVPVEWFETGENDTVLGLRVIPVDSAGIYVPGGRAAYPSSVLMNAIPAQIAGVKRIAMVTPCGKDKKVNPFILAAAKELGLTEIYKVGGAQAVAALTFGTKTIKKVDKIVGPGNIFVTLAKKQVFGYVGIDKLAGPSDVVIIADESADVRFIAADMLAQTEHDPMSSATLISHLQEIIRDTKSRIKKTGSLKGCRFIKTKSLDHSADVASQKAPEHLELIVSVPQKMLEKIKNAGAVFMGPYSPVAIGDYIAGPNHVLPTDGTARFASPLGVWDFIRYQSIVGYSKTALQSVKNDVVTLASTEGLPRHAASVEIRFS